MNAKKLDESGSIYDLGNAQQAYGTQDTLKN